MWGDLETVLVVKNKVNIPAILVIIPYFFYQFTRSLQEIFYPSLKIKFFSRAIFLNVIKRGLKQL